MAKFGLVLIVLAIAIFGVSIVVPQVLTPLAPLFCNSGDQLTVVKNTIGDRSTLICISLSGDKSDVTIEVSRVLGVVYGGLLVLGIALPIIAHSRKDRQIRNNASLRASQVFGAGRNPHVNGPTDSLQRGMMRINGQEISLDDLKSGAYQHPSTADNQRTLTDTLSQLEDAHKRGLINDDEYGHMRQEAMDKLV